MTAIGFPKGYHSLHANISMNFQMNRWYSWVGEPEMLDEMREAAPRMRNYTDWKREFLALAKKASRDGHVLRSGFYYRSAEFFMNSADPDRKDARDKFLDAVRQVYGSELKGYHSIPYTDGGLNGLLPAYRFKPGRSKGTIVFFGGFDSYIEECVPAYLYLRDAGYEVVAFEGPGQGGVLEAGTPMSPEWHKPVKAVLDYFELDHVALIGLSMGGCLAMRAAAFEPRVDRVVAFDILTDFFDVNLRQTNPVIRSLLAGLIRVRAVPIVNLVVSLAARKSPVVEWGIAQGMRVTGTLSPFALLLNLRRFQTGDVSSFVKQDVLLLCGSLDHYVPIEQLYRQIGLLTNARSVTARLFTPSESAQNHCQVGNYGLALKAIVDWLDEIQN